jgi:hypothetical protein
MVNATPFLNDLVSASRAAFRPLPAWHVHHFVAVVPELAGDTDLALSWGDEFAAAGDPAGMDVILTGSFAYYLDYNEAARTVTVHTVRLDVLSTKVVEF